MAIRQATFSTAKEQKKRGKRAADFAKGFGYRAA
jgi:hypothetical protein